MAEKVVDENKIMSIAELIEKKDEISLNHHQLV